MIDELIRSKRKTLTLVVDLQGRLIVKAPRFTSQAEIDQFIQKHSRWIQRQKKKMASLPPPRPKRKFVEGELFFYLGQEYSLTIHDSFKQPLSLRGDFQLARHHHVKARHVFTQWYKTMAREIFMERLQWYAKRHQFTFRELRLTSGKTRWGSCNCQGNISINWRLIMAPLPVIDYVLIHELAHTRELNHSPRFWALVEEAMPDYKQRKQWLDVHGALLVI